MTEPQDAEQQIRSDRLAKLDELRAGGTEPYPTSFEGPVPIAQARSRYDGLEPGAETGERVRVAGRIVGGRGHGKAQFLDPHDCTARIQPPATAAATPACEAVPDLDL